MAITTYSELQTAVTNWMARSDLGGEAADFIALAEARLNRELKPVVSDIDLTGTIDSNRIDISAHSVVSPMALFLAESGSDEVPLLRKMDGTFPYLDASGRPSIWSIDGTNTYIDFDRPLDAEYPFRFRARTRFALSDSAPTNWLLTNHPDVYLAATLVWSGLFTRTDSVVSSFVAILDDGIDGVRNQLAQQNRAVLTVDPALLCPTAYTLANWTADA
jgi:hypothetical protein